MITLTDPVLGSIDLEARPFVVASFQIGSKVARPVVRNRALANGGFDDTRFTGARAITLGLRLNEDDPDCDPATTMQSLYDQILPYMKPARRPVMSWALPGSSSDRRQMTVRGVDAPVVINRKSHPVLVCQFVSPDGEVTTDQDPICITLNPATDVELGRHYLDSITPVQDTYGPYYTNTSGLAERKYPFSLALGDRLVNNPGNADAHWILQIFGDVTNPFFKVNGITISFTINGGLAIPPGSSVIINTRERTVYLNGDPTTPRYDRTNFTAWQWADVLLKPGDNLVRFGAAVIGVDGSALLCYLPTWEG